MEVREPRPPSFQPAHSGHYPEKQMAESQRDRKRAKALSDRSKRKLVEFEGEKYLVKEPPQLAYEGVPKDAHGFRHRCIMLTKIVFDVDDQGLPTTPMFEDGDVDRLMEMGPNDPLLVVLTEAMAELTDPKKLEVDARKSAG